MDPFFQLNQWPFPAWPQGAWFGYPEMGVPGGADFCPQQLEQLQQSTEQQQPQLHEMRPLQCMANLQPPLSPLIHSPDGHDENTPPLSPSPSSTCTIPYTHSSYGMPLLKSEALSPPSSRVSTPPSEHSWAVARPVDAASPEAEVVAPPAPPPSEKRRGRKRKQQMPQKMGGKRKKSEGEEKEEEQIYPPSPSSVVAPRSPTIITGTGDTDVFCKVTGRLCVVGSVQTYNVSVYEVHRRTDLPEALNRSHIGPLLKRGKVSGCGDELQVLLEKRGLSAACNLVNRKRFPLTTLSALLEEESIQLSADHSEMIRDHFPFIGLARIVVRSFRSPLELSSAYDEVKVARSAMASLMEVLEEWTRGGWEMGTAASLSSPLSKFALTTHALGVQELLVMAGLFTRFLQTLDVECTAHFARLAEAAHGDPYAPLYMQFPPGMQQCELPPGRLHLPDAEEEAISSGSFTEIPGRLTLNNKKYNVTVAEIYRRIRQPESLNLSILGSLLRKGKTKDNCNALRDDLRKHCITLDSGRRKSARITCFTAMLEGEALVLAQDMEEEVVRNFPFGPMADRLIEMSPDKTPTGIAAQRDAFRAASRIAGSVEVAVRSQRLPVAERIPHKVPEHAYLMQTYCSITHGYGPDAVVSWMGHFKNMFEIAARSLPLD